MPVCQSEVHIQRGPVSFKQRGWKKGSNAIPPLQMSALEALEKPSVGVIKHDQLLVELTLQHAQTS